MVGYSLHFIEISLRLQQPEVSNPWCGCVMMKWIYWSITSLRPPRASNLYPYYKHLIFWWEDKSVTFQLQHDIVKVRIWHLNLWWNVFMRYFVFNVVQTIEACVIGLHFICKIFFIKRIFEEFPNLMFLLGNCQTATKSVILPGRTCKILSYK
jgi:hypothetical protein